MSDAIKISKSWLVLGIAAVLLVTNIATLLLWQPWSGSDSAVRKITVTGEASVKSAPDEYQFSPYYMRASNEEIIKLSTDITAKLKALGISDDKIKVTLSNYGQDAAGGGPESSMVVPNSSQSTLSVNVIVSDKPLAQKVQDYLLTTNPKGQVTPTPSFSAAKQKSLEAQARTNAIADARKKADQSAKELGAKVREAVTINDGNTGGGIMPLKGMAVADSAAPAAGKSLPVRPGENEINYSVQVTFSLR